MDCGTDVGEDRSRPFNAVLVRIPRHAPCSLLHDYDFVSSYSYICSPTTTAALGRCPPHLPDTSLGSLVIWGKSDISTKLLHVFKSASRQDKTRASIR